MAAWSPRHSCSGSSFQGLEEGLPELSLSLCLPLGTVMDTKTCKANVCPCANPLQAQRCDRVPLPCDPTRRGARRTCFSCVRSTLAVASVRCPSRPKELFCEGIHDRVAWPALDRCGTRTYHLTLHKLLARRSLHAMSILCVTASIRTELLHRTLLQI